MLRVYAIGDIHGSLRALRRLIAECERDADGRPMRLVFIGDYIDRGPDSRGVVDYIMSCQSRLAEKAICLMANHRAQRGFGKPETFNFLGFTFICSTGRNGKFLLQRKTRRDRLRAKLKEVKEEMRQRRHQPIPEQGKWLKQVLTGFLAYYAVPTNGRTLSAFRYRTIDLWRRSLHRRSQKDRTNWERITKLVNDFLPRVRILHPWPLARFAVTHPRWEPSARIGPARICAGSAQ